MAHTDDIDLAITPVPEAYDGFGFYTDTTTGIVMFYFFSELVKNFGPFTKDPAIPDDREPYHVILSSVRKNIIHVESPFLSNFIDPFAYAKNIARSGFLGMMIKHNHYAAELVKISLQGIMGYHANNHGFVYTDGGINTFFKGAKSK